MGKNFILSTLVIKIEVIELGENPLKYFVTAVFSVAVSGSSSKNCDYFISQWCFSGITEKRSAFEWK